MVDVAEFRPEDLLELDAERGQEFCTLEYGRKLAKAGPAYTVRDGSVLLCGGIATFHVEQENWLWSFVAKNAGSRMLTLHRHVSRFLAEHPVELMASTQKGFGPGCRWLAMLGFKLCGEDEIAGTEHLVYRRQACPGR